MIIQKRFSVFHAETLFWNLFEILFPLIDWLEIVTMVILFGQENVVRAGLICHPNGEQSKMVQTGQVIARKRLLHRLINITVPFPR